MHLGAGSVLVGEYRLERPLSRGGMGSVWVAHHLQLGTPVAVKFMDPAYANSPAFRTRFEREARVAAQLRTPHVVKVQDFGFHEGVPYLVMELVQGEDIHARLLRRGRRDPRSVLWRAGRACLLRSCPGDRRARGLRPGAGHPCDAVRRPRDTSLAAVGRCASRRAVRAGDGRGCRTLRAGPHAPQRASCRAPPTRQHPTAPAPRLPVLRARRRSIAARPQQRPASNLRATPRPTTPPPSDHRRRHHGPARRSPRGKRSQRGGSEDELKDGSSRLRCSGARLSVDETAVQRPLGRKDGLGTLRSCCTITPWLKRVHQRFRNRAEAVRFEFQGRQGADVPLLPTQLL
ncbi:protein kinase domain-containing protein [Sorangium sp. So ce887]|uniref:protein kinase domain-containing protein n=1 Tax=Sorangium sp. So ce887 TaxID=3133324 RepID=UPI003F61D267